MIYLKKFTSQDLRTGGGGSNTLVSSGIVSSGFFPTPLRTATTLKFYHGGRTTPTPLDYGYSGSNGTEVRIKSFSTVMTAEGAQVGDIGIFKEHPNEVGAYDVTFIAPSDPDFDFFNSLLSGNHGSRDILTDLKAAAPATTVIDRPHNWLVYGAPGTGKSTFVEGEAAVFGVNKTRITFYPDYTYAKFVGSYKPVTYYKEESGNYFHSRSSTIADSSIQSVPIIDYKFVPGPFLKILSEAYKDLASNTNHVLIIEELNRASAAAVFGEVFQLLDRTKGYSDYRVVLSQEAMLWIYETLNGNVDDTFRDDINENGIFLPPNLYIWATMNSADQGVFPLDSAFKRRWQIKYLPLNANESKVPDVYFTFGGINYQWNALRRSINSFLTTNSNVAEDRLIAPFFISPVELEEPETAIDVFKNKLLLYLKDDVLRHKKGFFNSRNQTIWEIDENFAHSDDPTKSWDFFSILTQEEGGAAKHIEAFYKEFIKLNASHVQTYTTPPDDEPPRYAIAADDISPEYASDAQEESETGNIHVTPSQADPNVGDES